MNFSDIVINTHLTKNTVLELLIFLQLFLLIAAELQLYGVQSRKKALMPNANSRGPAEHVLPCSLIGTSAVHQHILQYALIL